MKKYEKKEWNNLITICTRKGKREFFMFWSQHAIMLRRTSMGLNNFLISMHYFMLFVGDLLFIVSCVLLATKSWFDSQTKKKSIAFWWLNVLYKYLFSSHKFPFISSTLQLLLLFSMMFWIGACSSTPNVKFLNKHETTRTLRCETGYNKWYCLRFLRCRMGQRSGGREATMNNDDNYK